MLSWKLSPHKPKPFTFFSRIFRLNGCRFPHNYGFISFFLFFLYIVRGRPVVFSAKDSI